MRGIQWLIVGFAVAFAVPVQAANDGFEAAGVTGVTLSASSAGIADFALAGALSSDLRVSGASGKLVLVDEVVEDAVRFPLDPDAENHSVHGDVERYESTVDLADFVMAMESVTDVDARALVISGPGAIIDLALDSRYQATQVADHVVESSHALGPDAPFRPWRYYEYRSGDAVELSTAAGAEVLAKGNFQVYFWGQTLAFEDATAARTIRTGHTVEAGDGGLGQVEFVRDEHFRYAILSVTDGILQYTQASGPIRLFSPSIEAAPEGATYRGASGSIATPAGRLEFSDDVVRAEGGSYRWTLAGDGLAVTVLKAPAAATAMNGVFVAADAAGLPARAFAVAVALALLVAGYLYPTLRGGKTVPSGSGWSARRADGYASMAASAQTAGWDRLAAFWMAWSLRVVPADPLRMVDLAILRARIGKHEDAMRLHETAHGWLADSAHGEHVAHNAYEAAKTAARLDLPSQALDWMRMALEADPGLHLQVGREPAFAKLRDSPDYASLTVGGA